MREPVDAARGSADDSGQFDGRDGASPPSDGGTPAISDAGASDGDPGQNEPDAQDQNRDASQDAGQDASQDASQDAGPDAQPPDAAERCDPPAPCVCPHELAGPDKRGCVPEVCAIDECASDDDCRFESTDSGDYYFCDTKRMWQGARMRCESVPGLRLATIEDEDEDDFLFSQVADKTWVGASDLDQEGDWRWLDGTLFFQGEYQDGEVIDDAYTNFNPMEPNNYGLTSPGGHCLLLWTEFGNWADATCSDLHGYVCEVLPPDP